MLTFLPRFDRRVVHGQEGVGVRRFEDVSSRCCHHLLYLFALPLHQVQNRVTRIHCRRRLSGLLGVGDEVEY